MGSWPARQARTHGVDVRGRQSTGSLASSLYPRSEQEPDCLDCRRPMRFGYPPQCEKHPYDEDLEDLEQQDI